MAFYPVDAAPKNPIRPFRVTAHRMNRGVVYQCFVVGDYRYYWQANLISLFWHHVFGYGCNTWKASDARSKAVN